MAPAEDGYQPRTVEESMYQWRVSVDLVDRQQERTVRTRVPRHSPLKNLERQHGDLVGYSIHSAIIYDRIMFSVGLRPKADEDS